MWDCRWELGTLGRRRRGSYNTCAWVRKGFGVDVKMVFELFVRRREKNKMVVLRCLASYDG